MHRRLLKGRVLTRDVDGLEQNLFLENFSLKGIVQRDLTGVKTRLKRSVMMKYIVANFAF